MRPVLSVRVSPSNPLLASACTAIATQYARAREIGRSGFAHQYARARDRVEDVISGLGCGVEHGLFGRPLRLVPQGRCFVRSHVVQRAQHFLLSGARSLLLHLQRCPRGGLSIKRLGSPVAQLFIGSAGEVARPLPKTQAVGTISACGTSLPYGPNRATSAIGRKADDMWSARSGRIVSP
jgi:hypothetical protein